MNAMSGNITLLIETVAVVPATCSSRTFLNLSIFTLAYAPNHSAWKVGLIFSVRLLCTTQCHTALLLKITRATFVYFVDILLDIM